MKSGNLFLYVFLGLFFLISACQNDKEKKDYSGVSELISDRNKARHEMAENPPKKTIRPRQTTTGKPIPVAPELNSQKEDLSSIVLYEEDIKIVGSDSGRTLANGVAYINKKGQIVKIKILKDLDE